MPGPDPSRSARPWNSLAVLVAACLAACGDTGPAGENRDAPESSPAIPVRLAMPQRAELPRLLRAVGSFHAVEEVTVAAKAAGRVVAVHTDVGRRVGPGDLLLEVDDTDHLLTRDERRRALEAALARLGLSALPDGEIDLDALPTVQRARLAAANARARLERGTSLRQRDPPLISAQDLADMQTDWEMSESDVAVALLTAQSQLAEARTRSAELRTAEQRVADASHRVPAGDRPPLPGQDVALPAGPGEYVVAERYVSTGDYVAVGDPLLRLVDVDPVEFRVAVPERRMEGVAPGRAATLAVAGGQEVRATVARIRPEIDPRTRTFQVDLLVPNPDLGFTAGGFATVDIEVGRDRDVLLVDPASVRVFAGVRKVYLVQEDRAVERQVELGRRVSVDGKERVEIVSGLEPDTAYVLDPPPSLFGGAPVRVVPEDSSGTGEGAPEIR